LRAGAVTDALARCLELGKVRVAAYSGDDEPLRHAIASGEFGSVQASVNICDQRGLAALEDARSRGLGTMAKRPLAGRPWAAGLRPSDPVHAEYHRRFEVLRGAFGAEPGDWDSLALRFAAGEPGVDCVIVGGTNPRHLERNAAVVASGPLEHGLRAACRERFAGAGQAWRGMV
jgi:aryl-alcohol dehydrogenase-like predicted oxidoreductase